MKIGMTATKHIVSFSGGKDSTCMLLMMLEKGMQVDYIIFCDTGKEFPQMYEHIDKVNSYIKDKYGKEITILHAEKPFEYWMYEHTKKRGKHIGSKGYGWSTPLMRWCTREFKTRVFNKFIRRIDGKVERYVGIAYDEPKRIKDLNYPLVEWKITEKDALDYCYSKGFDWGGLYNLFNRVSCWLCPLQRIDSLRKLRKNFPKLWQELRDMDAKNTGTTFRKDYTVEELEEKFRKEDEKAKQLSLF